MRTMYDAVTARNILNHNRAPALVAGYIDKIKLEPWSASDWDLFPGARKVTIVKKASTRDGVVLDVEPGDATPEQAPGWAAQRRRDGFAYPVIYCNRSTWPLVRKAFADQKVAPPLYWIATASGRAEIPEGAIAAQYLLDYQGVDVSAVADYWPGVDPVPTTGGAAATTTGVDLMERITVTPPNTGQNAVRVFLPGSPGAAVIIRPRLVPGGKTAVKPMWVGHIYGWASMPGKDPVGIGHDPATVPGYNDRLDGHRRYDLPGAVWADINYSAADPFEIDIIG